MPQRFQSFEEFYPFYLAEHSNLKNRRMHFLGTTLSLTFLTLGIVTGAVTFLLYAVIGGYGCAWFGHFVFEKNKPATFKYPGYSLLGDIRMYSQIWKGEISCWKVISK